MHRGVESDVSYRVRKNASIPGGIRYFLQNMFQKHVFSSISEALVLSRIFESLRTLENT